MAQAVGFRLIASSLRALAQRQRLVWLLAMTAAALLLAPIARADQTTHVSTPREAQGRATHVAPGSPGAAKAAPGVPGTPVPAAVPATPTAPAVSAPGPAQGATPQGGAAAAAPTPHVPAGPPSLESLYRKGEAARKRGDTQAALADFKQILQRAPYHFLAHVGLGRLYLASQPALAARYLETAAQLQPSSAEAHDLLGRAYEGLGRDLDAAEQYRRAIYLDPHDFVANAHLRDVLQRMRAKRSPVERAADVFYEHPSLVRLTLFGHLVMQQMEPRQAVLEFEEVARRLPKLPEVELWLARARHAAGDLPGEISAYRQFLDKRPQATGVRLLLVQRLMTQGWYEEASGLLSPLLAQGTEAQSLAPDQQARVTFLHSRLLSAQQHPDKAAEALLEAAHQGYAANEITNAFADDLALHPESAGLWLAYGRWLHGNQEMAKAADALARAGMLDASLRPQARALLTQMRDQGQASQASALALGRLDWADGNAKAALASLAQVPVGSPLDHRAALLRGLIYRAQGNSEAALDAFLRYVLFFTDPNDQLYARGNVFWQTGHPEEALALWHKHPGVLTRHPQVLQHLADHERATGDVQGEIAAREELQQAEPGNLDNRIRLGALYALQGQRLQAVQLWEQVLRQRPRDAALLARVGKTWIALGKPELGLPRLQQAAELGALDPATSAMLAGELYREHRYEAALRTYWALYQTQPTQPDLPRVLPELVLSVPSSHAQRAAAARLAVQAGRLDAASQVLQTMVEDDPQDTDARMSLAEVYLRQNQPQRAEAVLVAPGTGGTPDEQGLRLLARVQERLGRKRDLNVTLERLQRLHPDDPNLRRRRALLLVSLRDYQTAEPMLEAAVAQAPHDEALQMALAHTALALRDRAEAEKHFQAVLAINPHQNDALRRLIALLLQDQRWADVVPRLEVWVRLHPKDVTARYNLITADLKLYRKEDARPQYEALRKLSPQRAAQLAPYFR